jgi:hypothetical protein
VSEEMGYTCRSCGQRHDGLPMSYGTDAPAYWSESFATDGDSVLDEELCVIQGEHFFIRGRVVIPVVDASAEFDWGVWVSLSRANFERAVSLWTDPDREREPPYFGWLSTDLPLYRPSTMNSRRTSTPAPSANVRSSRWSRPTIRSRWSSAAGSRARGYRRSRRRCCTRPRRPRRRSW